MGVFKGPAGPYGCFEAFLPTMGVFSVVPDTTRMGPPPPPTSQWGVEYHVPDSYGTEGRTVTSNSFACGTSILSRK